MHARGSPQQQQQQTVQCFTAWGRGNGHLNRHELRCAIIALTGSQPCGCRNSAPYAVCLRLPCIPKWIVAFVHALRCPCSGICKVPLALPGAAKLLLAQMLEAHGVCGDSEEQLMPWQGFQQLVQGLTRQEDPFERIRSVFKSFDTEGTRHRPLRICLVHRATLLCHQISIILFICPASALLAHPCRCRLHIPQGSS